MEVTQKEQDFTKPQVGPTKGFVTAEEARKKQGLPEPDSLKKLHLYQALPITENLDLVLYSMIVILEMQC